MFWLDERGHVFYVNEVQVMCRLAGLKSSWLHYRHEEIQIKNGKLSEMF
jgi:hypothetical protein